MSTALSPYVGFQKDVRGVRALWERFNAGLDVVDEACAPYERLLLADWRRCAALGVDAGMAHGHRLDEADYSQRREASRLLLDTAAPIFRDVGRFLVDVPGILILTEHSGTVLHICGDAAVQERAAAFSGIVEGSRWDEVRAGTNGVGSALVRGEPVHVHASEHFCEGWHSWSCAAAPVFDTDGRSVLGIVDFTTVHTDFRDQALGLAVSLADTVRSRMALQLELQRRRVLTAFSELASRYPNDDLLAIDSGGRVLAHSPNERCRLLTLAWTAEGRDARDGHDVRAAPAQARGLRGGHAGSTRQPAVRERFEVQAPSGGAPIGCVLLLARPPGCQQVFRHDGKPATDTTTLPAPPATHPPAPAPARFGDFLTTDDETRRLLGALARVATADVTLLLQGETGTGKELLARHVHELSARRDEPYLAVNCGAISETLMESTFFGYVRGAFSGADPRGHAGYFESAGGGTLFLDEVGELPAPMQAALLRVLEDGSFQRVGSCRTQQARCRIIAATHRDLAQQVAQGRFREDLYFRLRVVPFQLKPLRERPGDIAPLVERLCAAVCAKHGLHGRRFTADALQALQHHRWPGNVRELRNAIEAALLGGEGPDLGPECLPPEVHAAGRAGPSSGMAAVRDYERQVILDLLRQHRNARQVAAMLGMARSTLYRKFAELNIAHRDWDAGAGSA